MTLSLIHIYIGSKEYEILRLDDPVVLFDPDFPILTQDMPKDELMQKAAENPLNDKHLVIVEEPTVPDETDLEAERAINEHEAEYGADGTRVFSEVPNTSGYDLGFGPVSYTHLNQEGDVQAYSGSAGSSGKVYFGQKVTFQYKYGATTTWQSTNRCV